MLKQQLLLKTIYQIVGQFCFRLSKCRMIYSVICYFILRLQITTRPDDVAVQIDNSHNG